MMVCEGTTRSRRTRLFFPQVTSTRHLCLRDSFLGCAAIGLASLTTPVVPAGDMRSDTEMAARHLSLSVVAVSRLTGGGDALRMAERVGRKAMQCFIFLAKVYNCKGMPNQALESIRSGFLCSAQAPEDRHTLWLLLGDVYLQHRRSGAPPGGGKEAGAGKKGADGGDAGGGDDGGNGGGGVGGAGGVGEGRNSNRHEKEAQLVSALPRGVKMPDFRPVSGMTEEECIIASVDHYTDAGEGAVALRRAGNALNELGQFYLRQGKFDQVGVDRIRCKQQWVNFPRDLI
jgi:hypothetical protein